MKKFVGIILCIIMTAMIITGIGETLRDYGISYDCGQDFVDKNELKTFFVEREVLKTIMYEENAEELTKKYVWEITGMSENDDAMYLNVVPEDYSRIIVFVYDAAEEDLDKMDRNILRVFIIEVI